MKYLISEQEYKERINEATNSAYERGRHDQRQTEINQFNKMRRAGYRQALEDLLNNALHIHSSQPTLANVPIETIIDVLKTKIDAEQTFDDIIGEKENET